MTKYKVVFSIDYDIEANSEAEARDKAENKFIEEVQTNPHHGFTEYFRSKSHLLPKSKPKKKMRS